MHVHAHAHPGRRAGGRGRGRIVPSAVTRWRKGSASMRRSCPTSRLRKRRGRLFASLSGVRERSPERRRGRLARRQGGRTYRCASPASVSIGARPLGSVRAAVKGGFPPTFVFLRNTGRAFHLHGSVMKKSFRIPKVEIPLWRAFPFRALGISKKVLSFCLILADEMKKFSFFFSSLTSET